MNQPLTLCNSLLILLTSLVSYLGFRSRAVEEKYIFQPEAVLAGNQYYRLVTSAFLHADWRHLGLNMLSLYLFGGSVEHFLGKTQFLLTYFGAIVGGSLLSLYVHRHHDYRAYGASGGVCGIIFAHLLLFPGGGIYMFPFPFAIPSWLYAVGFLLGSFYGMKARNQGNIGHDAHLGGAIVGLLIAAALNPWVVRDNLRIFLIVLVTASLLLVYLWFNPLLLPVSAFFARRPRKKTRAGNPPRYKQQSLLIDAVLEKIARHGINSLTPQEKALLGDVAAKYQRRAESKKPDSGLAI